MHKQGAELLFRVNSMCYKTKSTNPAIHLKDYRVGEINMDNYPGEGMRKLYHMLHLITQFAEVSEGALPIKEMVLVQKLQVICK